MKKPPQNRFIIAIRNRFTGTSSDGAAGDCAAGYYCTGGSSVPTQFSTEQGHYSPEGSYDQIPCPRGQYQPARQSATCLVCPKGYYCNGTGTINEIICPAGSFCVEGSEIPEPCPPGMITDNILCYFLIRKFTA